MCVVESSLYLLVQEVAGPGHQFPPAFVSSRLLAVTPGWGGGGRDRETSVDFK